MFVPIEKTLFVCPVIPSIDIKGPNESETLYILNSEKSTSSFNPLLAIGSERICPTGEECAFQ